RRQVLVHPQLVLLREVLAQRFGVLAHGIEDAALAVDPSLLALAEQTIEQLVWNHLRRQGTIVAGPAHVPLDALAEGLLRDADLQRAEAGIGADSRSYRLVDGWSARAAPRKRRTRKQAAGRLMMPVAGTRRGRGGIVDSADHVNVAAERGQR